VFQPGGPTFLELTRQALTSTKHGYDLLAPKFDQTPFRTPDAVLHQVAQRVRDTGPVGRALDVCCGTGAGMIMLRPLCTQEVVGIDFSPGMLDEARRRVGGAPGTATTTFIEGDALDLPFESEFDVATCFGALGHFPPAQQPDLIAGIHRALKPGGRFVFVTSPMPPKRSTLYWIYRTFNGIMRVRNALIKPEFIMYYLEFTVPGILPMFDRAGFEVTLHDVQWERRNYKIAVATRRPD